MNAVANRWRLARPDITLSLRPYDPIARPLQEDYRLADTLVTRASAAASAAAARRVLLSDPLTAAALRQIGVAEGLSNRSAEARQLITLAHRVSRHEPGMLVWLIEDSLARGQLEPTLRYFDEALLTNRSLENLLYPALASALFDRSLRADLALLLRQRRSWMAGFLRYAVSDVPGADRYVAAIVLAAGGLPHSPDYTGLDSAILTSFAAENDFGRARLYLGRLGKKGSAALAEMRFTSATIRRDLGPFTWSFAESGDISAQRDDDGGLNVRVMVGVLGPVAQRYLAMPPGGYSFTQSVVVPDGAVPADMRWELHCLPGRADVPMWALNVPGKDGASSYAAQIDIPEGCQGQLLKLIAGNSDSDGDAEMVISGLALRRR